MEIKSATLQLNRAATAVDNSGSENKEREQTGKVVATVADNTVDNDDESVKISISQAGLRKSMNTDSSAETEMDSLLKKIDGLSSQLINGHFSIADRMRFQREIARLTGECEKLNGNGISFSKTDNVLLSQEISDLTRTINEAAVYHRSAKALFVVNNQPNKAITRTTLDIAL